MSNKKGLGKGFNVFIPNINKNNDYADILDISLIKTNKNQPRKQFDEDSLEELAKSIKEFGILQPIIVQKKDVYYEIVAGERRWRAAKIAGITKIPVIIKNYNDRENLEVSLIENIQRENLNPIDEALAYKRLVDEFHMKQEEIGNRVSKSRVTITNSLRLLKLNKDIQDMVIKGEISGGHARALLAINDDKKQFDIALKIVNDKLSVRDVEKIAKSMSNKEKKCLKFSEVNNSDELFCKEIENRIREILGTKVTIKNSNNKGKIEIEYYSQEELERLIEFFEK